MAESSTFRCALMLQVVCRIPITGQLTIPTTMAIYRWVGEIDESSKNAKDFDIKALLAAGESVPVS